MYGIDSFKLIEINVDPQVNVRQSVLIIGRKKKLQFVVDGAVASVREFVGVSTVASRHDTSRRIEPPPQINEQPLQSPTLQNDVTGLYAVRYSHAAPVYPA